jgi:DNA polymerase
LRQVKTAIVSNPAQTDPALDPAAALAAVLDWWREAGVDHAFSDDPRVWLTEPAAPEPEQRAPAAPQPAPARAVAPAPVVERLAGLDALPAALPEFQQWWLSEPSLDGGHVAGRVAPRGVEGAALMVLVDHPEVEDAQLLLSGPQGRLLLAMFTAMGIDQDSAYIAACLPRHMPLPDWAGLDAAGLGQVVRHHIGLVRPRRLLVFGRHISPLLGHDPTKTAEPLRHFNHEGLTIPLLIAPSLANLAGRLRSKAGLWQAWLDWTG